MDFVLCDSKSVHSPLSNSQIQFYSEFAAAAANPAPAIIHIPRCPPRPITLFVGAGVTEAVALAVTPGRVVAVAVELVEADFDEEAVVVVTTASA